ncbi:AMP-binding protein [Subtercola lobariae]|uniref:O-succinylbenzoic acid--CoA ligase n=1 Tax=Subtercola lobariae TaxID=1588641 RepID=A0A917AYU4_9MICO|nr:AMP-binding protein [Subtercola lobariae]GGF11180.1 O-succinylbenzoic acid--CoA ligase [Subtercola lobariae]
MTRRLEVLPAGDAAEVSIAVRAALSGTGPAILPREPAVAPHSRHASGAPGPAELPDEVPKNVALVIETSGSSGVPKRVALSADALLASAGATESELGGPGQWVLALPTHYIAGTQVLIRSIVAATKPVVLPPGHFSARAFAACVDELQAGLKFSSIVPAQLARLVDAGESDTGIRESLRALDALLIGGQAVPAALFTRATDLGLNVKRTYGSSETSGGCVYDGHPIGQASARTTGGELELAGPMLAEGYLGDDELTARKFYSDAGRRWYRTADSGEVTSGPAGVQVAVSGRLDNVIISGGIKVALDRVERIVQAHEGFHTAIVVPVPSEQWGQTSVVVTSEPFGDGDLAVLQSAVTEAVGRPAAPSRIVRLEPLPTLASGKPDRLAVARTLAKP